MDMQGIILELISRNDGKWTWYQLERGLDSKGLGGCPNLMELIGDLVQAGLLEEQHDDRFPHPLYRVTKQGHAVLATSKELRAGS